MSAATSIFVRSFYAASADVLSRAGETSRGAALRGLAAAVIAGAAVGPAMAQYSDNYEPGAQSPATTQSNGRPSLLGSNSPGVTDGVKQIGEGIGTIFSGVGRFLSRNANSDARNTPARDPNDPEGYSTSPQPVNPQAANSQIALPQLAPAPSQATHTDPTRIGPAQQEAYDKLAVNAAAHRLVAEASYLNFSNAKENYALNPRNEMYSKLVITARKALDRDIASLNIAVNEFSYATNVLAQKYKNTNFSGYRALQSSISAPIEVRATEVAAGKPIAKPAEELALQIMNGAVPRATAVTPGGNSMPADAGSDARRFAYRSR